MFGRLFRRGKRARHTGAKRPVRFGEVKEDIEQVLRWGKPRDLPNLGRVASYSLPKGVCYDVFKLGATRRNSYLQQDIPLFACIKSATEGGARRCVVYSVTDAYSLVLQMLDICRAARRATVSNRRLLKEADALVRRAAEVHEPDALPQFAGSWREII